MGASYPYLHTRGRCVCANACQSALPHRQGNAGHLDANGIGAAAAMQALKRFTQGGQPAQTSGGQSALVRASLQLWSQAQTMCMY